MSQVVLLKPAKWVTKEVLTLTTGLKPGTIRRAREKSWLLGREYLHVSPEGAPLETSECMYNTEAIEKWIESQIRKQPNGFGTKVKSAFKA
ncbi:MULTISPECIES: excisionase family protein [Tatumella]|uniref:Excisionase family protein n=1 Tax=Tatumella punctata TaxID=399969 RepID=A0ABW1VTS5_9GAMM|nr:MULTISPECIES: excisionase family protein [unclassified Tatumella]MBS0878048.1 excisionase family protein [Tatumella sp. JGM82]MBS0891229.1 excisionase family protein [Tatumella sp. JGM94]MBS0895122.1 excisionase family protein [Tatumella sp. JGM130]MBS0902608.1 excisionase family protein [Tatumella sp. JGM100]